MIVLHSVSKELRNATSRKLVLDRVDWRIPARSQVVILGQKGAGKSTLMQIISGGRYPTSGWVERRGSICSPDALTKIRASTPRQYVVRLAHLYNVDPDELTRFVGDFAELRDLMTQQLKNIPKTLRSRLTYALAYGIPFDYYLFDDGTGASKTDFGKRCQAAFEQRCRDTGVLIATSIPKFAEKFSDASGAILHEGSIQLFPTVGEAIDLFRTLPPPPPEVMTHVPTEDSEESEHEFV